MEWRPAEAGPPVASAEDIRQEGPFRFRKTEFFCPELDHINKCAYSDYQREKIYVRTSPAIRKSLRRKQRLRKRTLKVNEHIECEHDRSAVRSAAAARSTSSRRRPDHKTVFDLKFTLVGGQEMGHPVQLATVQVLVPARTHSYADEYRSVGDPVRQRSRQLGHSTTMWHCVRSYEDVTLSLNEIFGFSFGLPFLEADSSLGGRSGMRLRTSG